MGFFKLIALPFIALAAVVGTLFAPKTVDIPIRGIPLFEEAGYDSFAPKTAFVGSYGLSETVTDSEGRRWGCVDGLWVDLDALDAVKADPPPLTVWYAESDKLGGQRYESYSDGPTDILTVCLAFYPTEELREIVFYSVGCDPEGAEVWMELHSIDSLSADSAFLAAVKFYGDLTLYGICCTNSEGISHRYLVSISGRNNSVLLTQR